MTQSDLSELELEEEGMKLRLSRKNGYETPAVVQAPPQAHPHQPVAAAAADAPQQPAEEEKGVDFIKSPMVGTFYAAPSPESANFVEPGSKVTGDTVVCIIEAMKVMNEIQAEISGTILEPMVENGQAVEYGQPLFKVKTA